MTTPSDKQIEAPERIFIRPISVHRPLNDLYSNRDMAAERVNDDSIEYVRVPSGAQNDLGIDTPFPLSETLRLLAQWAQHLHVSHECDCYGWEQRSFLIEAAQRYQQVIAAATAPITAPQDER